MIKSCLIVNMEMPSVIKAHKIIQREIDLKEIDMVTGKRIIDIPNSPKHEMGQ